MNRPEKCQICNKRFKAGEEFAVSPISLFTYHKVRITVDGVVLCENCMDDYGQGYKALNGGYGEKWDWDSNRRII
jgi:hypothetical protein